jgi:hypothetical protein
MTLKLNALSFTITGALLGMLPVFMPELFPANSFNGGSTSELWQQFWRLGATYAAGFLGFRIRFPGSAARAKVSVQLRSLHVSVRASMQSWRSRPGVLVLPPLSRVQG